MNGNETAKPKYEIEKLTNPSFSLLLWKKNKGNHLLAIEPEPGIYNIKPQRISGRLYVHLFIQQSGL